MGATLFMDMLDIWKKVKSSDSEDIILHRFEKGAKVPRVLHPEWGAFKDTRYFNVFSPTLIATNQAVPPVLEGRCLLITMPEANRNYPEPREKDSLPLRERLVAWRAHMMGGPLPEVRELDITLPLRQIALAISGEASQVIDVLCLEFDRQRKLDKATSDEAELLQVIIDCEGKVDRGKLSIKEIANKLNEGRDPRFWLSPETVGRRVKPLGFVKDRLSDGKMAIRYDKPKIEELKTSYCLLLPEDQWVKKPSEPSVPSVQIGEEHSYSEGSEGTEGLLDYAPLVAEPMKSNASEPPQPTQDREQLSIPHLPDGRVLNWQWCLSTWEKLGKPLVHAGDRDNIEYLEHIFYPEKLSPGRLQGIVTWLEEYSKETMT
jgi:hypothetical protein